MFSLGESKGICNEISTDITILGWEVAVAGVVGVHEVEAVAVVVKAFVVTLRKDTKWNKDINGTSRQVFRFYDKIKWLYLLTGSTEFNFQ